MFCIGNVSPRKKRRLVEITRQSIEVGLKEVKPWNFLGDMGAAIHDLSGKRLQRSPGCGGHGVGLQFHEEPWVSYVSERGTEMLMVPGMMFTIEPMVNMGKRMYSWTRMMTGPYTQRTENRLPSGKFRFWSQKTATKSSHTNEQAKDMSSGFGGMSFLYISSFPYGSVIEIPFRATISSS